MKNITTFVTVSKKCVIFINIFGKIILDMYTKKYKMIFVKSKENLN